MQSSNHSAGCRKRFRGPVQASCDSGRECIIPNQSRKLSPYGLQLGGQPKPDHRDTWRGGTTQAGTYVSQQLGDLVQEFSAYPSGDSGTDSCVDCSTPCDRQAAMA